MVEAESIFVVLIETGLIFPGVYQGRRVFKMNEAKEHEWNAFIAELKSGSLKNQTSNISGGKLVSEGNGKGDEKPTFNRFVAEIMLAGSVGTGIWVFGEHLISAGHLSAGTRVRFVAFAVYFSTVPITAAKFWKPKRTLAWVSYAAFSLLMYCIFGATWRPQAHLISISQTKTATWNPPELSWITASLPIVPLMSMNMAEWRTLHTNWTAIGNNSIGEAIFMEVQSNRLYMKADVQATWGPKLGPPIQIRGDKITGIPQNWDLNSNSNRLEIVDDRGYPIFQIRYEPEGIAIYGLFVSKGWIWEITPRISFLAGQTGIDPFQLGLKPMFAYPSTNHPNELSKD